METSLNLGISYMGTKRFLVPNVEQVVESVTSDGPFMDLFSGMCAVSSIIKDRPIWCNDTQLFACRVAEARYKSHGFSLTTFQIENLISKPFESNVNKLRKRFVDFLEAEATALSSESSFDELQNIYDALPNVQTDNTLNTERLRLHLSPNTSPWRLFSITYAGGYFGISQCIEIDSLRFALDKNLANGKITQDEYLWLIITLAMALPKCATTTGHFAQYINLKQSNHKYFLKQRRKSIWLEWMAILGELRTAEEPHEFRSQNRVFNCDANVLLNRVSKYKRKPAVIYADPPYTRDQYSRYYHLYETFIKYDYPDSHGSGRYPSTRFKSNYSMRTQVHAEMLLLIQQASKSCDTFILSYPENSILQKTKETVLNMLKSVFAEASVIDSIAHRHSTMGASNGSVKNSVNELIFMAR